MFDLREYYVENAIDCIEELNNANSLNYLTQEYLSAQRYIKLLYEEKLEQIVRSKESHEDK